MVRIAAVRCFSAQWHLTWFLALVMLMATTGATAHGATPAPGWSRAGDMAFGRASVPAVTLQDGQVLVTSGHAAEIFDPVTQTFSDGGASNIDRSIGFSATLLENSDVLVAGGPGHADAELYDPVTGTYTPTGDMSELRSFHTATRLTDGRVLFVGGSRFGGVGSDLGSAEIYDPDSKTFSPTGSLTVPRQQHTATLLDDGRVLVTGGYGSDPFVAGLATAEIYDPSNGTFTPTAEGMGSGRGQHTAMLLGNGSVLIAGGFLTASGQAVASAENIRPLHRHLHSHRRHERRSRRPLGDEPAQRNCVDGGWLHSC